MKLPPIKGNLDKIAFAGVSALSCPLCRASLITFARQRDEGKSSGEERIGFACGAAYAHPVRFLDNRTEGYNHVDGLLGIYSREPVWSRRLPCGNTERVLLALLAEQEQAKKDPES